MTLTKIGGGKAQIQGQSCPLQPWVGELTVGERQLWGVWEGSWGDAG